MQFYQKFGIFDFSFKYNRILLAKVSGKKNLKNQRKYDFFLFQKIYPMAKNKKSSLIDFYKIFKLHNRLIIKSFLYKNQQQQQTDKMAKLSDSNVEFFNSQSSFGSSSALSYSRAHDLADQLIDQSETIFHSLQQMLLPRDDLVKWPQIKHIIHRGRILAKDTIPQNLVHLQREPEIRDHKINQIKLLRGKLNELLNNYQAYDDKLMTYEKFYQLYGSKHKNDLSFHKKQPMQIQIHTDVVQIVDNHSASRNLKANNIVMTPVSVRDSKLHRQKQICELRDQINRLHKRQRALESQKLTKQIQYKQQTQNRINKLLKLYKNSTSTNQQLFILQQELDNKNIELEKQYASILNMNRERNTLEEQLRDCEYENNIIKEELESYRRIANSRISEVDDDQCRSALSEHEGTQSTDIRKLQKIIRNLKYEKNLLRSQLNKQREMSTKSRKREQSQIQEQNIHLKKLLSQKNIEIHNINADVDQSKIQNIRLLNKINGCMKTIQIMKANQKNIQPNTQNNQRMMIDQSVLSNSFEQNNHNKFIVGSYAGNGDEGYPYYELINREFRIRFRRACLRDKQLLYKASGLEIGVISQFSQPSTLKTILHISNFCDQQSIKNFSLKITNIKNNKVTISQKTRHLQIQSGKQIKCPVSVNIKHYPIGSTVLFCQYDYYDKHEEVRVILPVHIFKMLVFKPRDGEFNSPRKDIIKSQRKIAKDINSLKQYFKGASFHSNSLKSTVYHQHTDTKIFLDISENRPGQFQIISELRSGQQNIYDYVWRTLEFLLKKEN